MKSRHSGSSLPVEGSHDAGHFQSGLGSLQTTIVILIETADFGLLSILEQQNFVDDWNFGFDLDERERLAQGFKCRRLELLSGRIQRCLDQKRAAVLARAPHGHQAGSEGRRHVRSGGR